MSKIHPNEAIYCYPIQRNAKPFLKYRGFIHVGPNGRSLISTYLAILCFKHFQNVTELEKKQIDESYFENTTVGLFFKCNVLKIIQYLSRKLKASLYSMQ